MTDSAQDLPAIASDTSHLGLVLDHFGIMQKQAAESIGVDASMITKWKKGITTFGVASKSMKPLVDYILSPARKLTEADHRWLRAHFAEAGLEYRYSNLDELRTELTNYLANDGSVVGKKDIERQRLYSREFFSIGGLNEIALFLEDELLRCPEGHSVMLAGFGCGIESEPTIHGLIARAVAAGMRLKMLLGWKRESDEGDLFAQRYLPELVSPGTLARNAASPIGVLFDAQMVTIVLVPGRLCMHITGRIGVAPYVASVIRQPDYLREAERGFMRALAEGEALFENPHESTPRFISERMSAFYHGEGDVLVASDGLNPLFMSPEAFGRFLSRKGCDDAERAWRIDAFRVEQDALEQKLCRGGCYREMSVALDKPCVREQGMVAANGQTFFDAQLVDLETALDILQGYLRFASLHSRFEVRFANPSCNMAQGLWMMAPCGMCENGQWSNKSGFILCRRDAGNQQLYSEDERLVRTACELFEDAWGRIRYRVFSGGRMLTSETEDGSADASRNVRFIRERIDALKQLIAQRGA